MAIGTTHGYHVAITTDDEMDQDELNALTDIALLRFINSWIGNANLVNQNTTNTESMPLSERNISTTDV